MTRVLFLWFAAALGTLLLVNLAGCGSGSNTTHVRFDVDHTINGVCLTQDEESKRWVGKHSGTYGYVVSIDSGPTIESDACFYDATVRPDLGLLLWHERDLQQGEGFADPVGAPAHRRQGKALPPHGP